MFLNSLLQPIAYFFKIHTNPKLFSIKHRFILSLCFYKVKQTRKVNLASEIMTKILTNEMEFARKTWVPIYAFYSRRQEIFQNRISHIQDFHIEPIFHAQHNNNFGFIKTQLSCNFVQFNTQTWSNLNENCILTTLRCSYLMINLHGGRTHAVSQRSLAMRWLVQSYHVTSPWHVRAAC